MTREQVVREWRKRIADSFVSGCKVLRVRTSKFKTKFFDHFEKHFDAALETSGITLEKLVWAEHQIDVDPYEPEVQRVFSSFRQALDNQLQPRQPLPEKEFRPGSGATTADGSNKDVVKVKPRGQTVTDRKANW